MTAPPIPAGVDRRRVIWPNAKLILSGVDSSVTTIPEQGRVTITAAVPHVTVLSVEPNLTLTTRAEQVSLDADGVMRALLVCTDDPDVSPSNGWTYTFRGDWPHSPTITCPVPMVPLDPVTGEMPALDLSSMVSVPIVDGVMVTKGEKGDGVENITLSSDGGSLEFHLTGNVTVSVPIPALGDLSGYVGQAQTAAGTATTEANRAETEADRAEQAAADIEAGAVPDGAVTTPKLADDAVISAKLAPAVRSDLAGREQAANRGAANGYAPLDASTKIPATYLPSYVDDVVEYANQGAFPATGETGKIYTALDSNKIYRWSGSAYVEISPSPGSTDAVPEGSTNLYFSNARAQAAVAADIAAKYTKPAGGIPATDLATGRVVGSNNGTAANLTIWVGTEAQYTAIGTKDPNTLYFRTA
ncbi:MULTISPECIES: hypothetical protein [Rhodococcus]|uniref:phage upper tail fiber protein n=1 Tax=Rhodococcus TaxID=1827 RepID=UPI00167C7DF1|nr:MULTISPECIES: hypothetical protein [Rhodococcus]